MNDVETLLEAVEDKILERGRAYYESGMVQDLSGDSNGNFTASVEGSELTPYKVQVSIDPKSGEVLSYGCSCPYEFGDICKHVVAVFLAIRDGNYKKTGEIRPVDFSQCVEALSLEQLRKLVLAQAERDRDFENEVLLTSGRLNDDQVFSKIKEQMKEAVRSGTHKGFIDWRGCDEICAELDQILNTAQDRMKEKKLTLAFRIILEIIRTGVRLASIADSSSGSLTDVLCRSQELLQTCCKEISDVGTDKEKEQCLDRLMKVSQEKRFDGWDDDAYSLLHTAVCFLKEKNSMKWYAVLDAMKEKEESRNYSDYALEENALLRMESIEKLNGADAAKEYLYANLKWDRFRKMALERAVEKKNYLEAERLCLEKLSSKERFNRTDWLEYLYGIYGFLYESGKQADTAKALLFTGSLDYFDRLKELLNADGTWEKEYPNLMNDCETKLSFWQYQQLLEHTGEHRLLMDTVRKYPESVFQYGSLLAPLFPTEVFPIYDREIRKSAEMANSRPQYKRVCSQIRGLYQIGGKETAAHLIASLAQTYPRRSAFLDELSKLQGKLSKLK
ncbi:SWIM zinc finger family protein [Caproicibacter sp.]|uniref:SWIM zinc finger family protein n=1 Tax=Caproicibacter sp. TaxID=2814884 RepID=UPI003988C166